MPSIFDCLQVIEFQLSASAPSSATSLKALRNLTHAFSPESCARQVMIFFDVSNIDKFNKHFERVSGVANKSAHLRESEAYRFLLSWVVGGEYRATKPGYKIAMFNDSHILGRFKERWVHFLEFSKQPVNLEDGAEIDAAIKQKAISQQIKLIDVLLTDAHEIRKRMESRVYGKGDALRSALDVILANVILSRTYGLPVVYESMNSDTYKETLLEMVGGELNKLMHQLKSYPEESPASQGITLRISSYTRSMGLLQAADEQKTISRIVNTP
jgi:hypothetical protein